MKTEFQKRKFIWTEPEKSQDEDYSLIRIYSCHMCGAKFAGGKAEEKFLCPQCGKDSILESGPAYYPNPRLVIPFGFDKADAIEKYKRYIYDSKLLSDTFADDHNIKSVTGVYIPQWIFCGEGEADVQYISMKYKPDGTKKGKYIYSVDGYDIPYSFSVNELPVAGIEILGDKDYMSPLGAYDIKKAVPLKPEHLEGFIYQLDDVDESKAVKRAERVIDQYTADYFENDMKKKRFHKFVKDGVSSGVKNGTYQLVLFPVWIICIETAGRPMTYAINGQTEKIYPISANKQTEKQKENGTLLAVTFGYFLVFMIVSIIFFHEKGNLIYDLIGSAALSIIIGLINAVVTKIKSRKNNKKFRTTWIGGSNEVKNYLSDYEIKTEDCVHVLFGKLRWFRISALITVIMAVRYKLTFCDDIREEYERRKKKEG